jgi:hypothetical protein
MEMHSPTLKDFIWLGGLEIPLPLLMIYFPLGYSRKETSLPEKLVFVLDGPSMGRR